MEEGDEEAGPERQQVGRRGSSLAREQRPRRKGMRKQGRRGSKWAGEAAAWLGSSGHGGRGLGSRAGEAAGGPERQRLGRGAVSVEEGAEEARAGEAAIRPER